MVRRCFLGDGSADGESLRQPQVIFPKCVASSGGRGPERDMGPGEGGDTLCTAGVPTLPHSGRMWNRLASFLRVRCSSRLAAALCISAWPGSSATGQGTTRSPRARMSPARAAATREPAAGSPPNETQQSRRRGKRQACHRHTGLLAVFSELKVGAGDAGPGRLPQGSAGNVPQEHFVIGDFVALRHGVLPRRPSRRLARRIEWRSRPVAARLYTAS